MMKFLINNFKKIFYLSLIIPAQVFSAEEKTISSIKTDPMSGGYLLQLILGLLVVIACIVALAWIAKRMNRLQSSTDGNLKVLAGLNMSARDRVVLLQVGNQQLLVGVSPGRINTLHVLDEPVSNDSAESTKNVNGFAEKMSSMLSPEKNSRQNRKGEK